MNRQKLNRKIWKCETQKQAQEEEIKALTKMTFQEKSSMITFLRECYYGKIAVTGRVQRIYSVSKRK